MYVCVYVYQQVLWFDVPVHDVHPVQILDGPGQVEDHGAGVALAVLGGGGDGVEQVAALETQQSREEEEAERNRRRRRRRRGTLTSSMTRNSWLGVSSTSISWMMLGCRTRRSTATSFSIRCSCSHTQDTQSHLCPAFFKPSGNGPGSPSRSSELCR